MARSLPARPSLESLKKQAKALLRAHRRGDPAARALVAEHFAKESPDGRPFASLRDAQAVVAREYGWPDWDALRRAVADAVTATRPLADAASDFLLHACVTYTAADAPRRWEHARRVLEQRPDVAGADVHAAAASGDVAALRRFLDADPASASRAGGPHGWPPLLYLAFGRVPDDPPARDALAAARLLLDRGADPNAAFVLADRYRFSALCGAVGDGEGALERAPRHQHARSLAELLLEAGADPNDPQVVYDTHFGADTEWIELLLRYGLTADALVDWTAEEGSSEPRMRTLDWLLARDVVTGRPERARLLLENGADPNARDYYNARTAHENALLYGRSELVPLLERYGAAPGRLDAADRYRAACMAGDAAAARAVAAAEPDLEVAAETVTEAIRHGSDAAALLLAERVRDASEQDANGTTPLHLAALHRKDVLCERLLEKGARLDLRDRHYDGSPIGWAAQGGDDALRERLLDRTTDVFDLARYDRAAQLRDALARDASQATRRRARGVTALHGAAVGATPEAIELLLLHGADVNARTDEGETPLDVALAHGRPEIVELLRARGGVEGEA